MLLGFEMVNPIVRVRQSNEKSFFHGFSLMAQKLFENLKFWPVLFQFQILHAITFTKEVFPEI